MIDRPKDEPWPGGRGVYDWTRGRFVPVLARESADTFIRRKALAHPHLASGSTAEQCALHGGERFWAGRNSKQGVGHGCVD